MQINSAEFIHCKELVDEYLHSLEFSLPANAIYIFDSSQIQEDSDEYYDGFRCLYKDEEMNPGKEENCVKGLVETQPKDVSPCPPLHPAVN